MRAFPDVQYRHIFKEEWSPESQSFLNYDQERTWKLQLRGRDQAKEALMK
jgi:hypothetical protein